MAATEPAARTSNAELIRWAFDVVNTHDVAPLKEVWTAETVERFPMRTAHGADDIASVFDEAFAAMPDLHPEIAEVAAEGDNVFVRWHMTGTHSGAPWNGVAASGKPIE